jgi:lipopolysaccharide export LptBFGC system permease protein LptF
MNLLTPILWKLFPKEIKLPELEHLPSEKRAAILDKAINSTEHHAYQETYQSWPLFMAIVLGSTPLTAVPFAREMSVFALFFWPLLVLVLVLAGLVLGLVSKRLKDSVLMLVVIVNIGGFFRCIVLADLIAAVCAVVATAVAYAIVLNLGCWLFLHREVRLLRSLARRYVVTCDREA